MLGIKDRVAMSELSHSLFIRPFRMLFFLDRIVEATHVHVALTGCPSISGSYHIYVARESVVPLNWLVFGTEDKRECSTDTL